MGRKTHAEDSETTQAIMMDEYRLTFAESILLRYYEYRNEGRIPKAIKLTIGELQLLRDFLDDELILIEGPDEERILAALQEEKGDAFQVLAINAGESRTDALEFVDFLKAPAFRFGLDQSLVISDAYGVYGLPMSVFIDSDGVVRSVYQGHANRARLASLVDAAIQARAPVEMAPELRPLTTIERDRIITVSRVGEGRLVLASRALRCDLTYCAETWLRAIETVAGVTELSFSMANANHPELSIEFDTRLSEQTLIDEVLRLLEASQDPLYRRPVEVRYAD